MQRLYCYVDETGQDTSGKLFIVSVVVTEQERDLIETQLEQLEQRSGKKKARWIKTSLRAKQLYLTQIFQSNLFVGKLFYKRFSETTDYLGATLVTISQAIHQTQPARPYTATVFIEGFNKYQVRGLPTVLRKRFGLSIRKVRPLPHTSNAIVRLADALCGFTRDCLEGEPYGQPFLTDALTKQILEELQ